MVYDSDHQKCWFLGAPGKYLEGAHDAIDENHGLFAIVLDGCVPGAVPNTIPLIKHILSLELPSLQAIVAVSNEEKYRKRMLTAGCTHETTKNAVATLLNKIREMRRTIR